MEVFSPFAYTFAVKKLDEDLSELKKNDVFANGIKQTDREGPKTDPFHVLDNPEFVHSKEVLRNEFNLFAKEQFDYECTWDITTSWMTKLKKGESIHMHNHRNCLWSGVLFFDDYTEDSCPLKFKNPIEGTLPVYVRTGKYNGMYNDAVIHPEKNLVIFFPSHIYHYSDKNQAKSRKSLAFNFMPNTEHGIGDSKYDPTWKR